MRSDASKNYEHLLAIATDVIAEQGAEASLRDIARRAGVVVGTLYRHFPTREALLDAVLRSSFDQLTARADELSASQPARSAFETWMRECFEFTRTYQGVTAVMMNAMDDPASALHASCSAVRAAGARLLVGAQEAGAARDDIDGVDQFALVAAAAWLAGQPTLASRGDHLFDIVMDAVSAPATGGRARRRR